MSGAGCYDCDVFGTATRGAAAPQRIVAVGDLHGDYAAWIDSPTLPAW